MAVTMDSATFMGKNFQDNQNSIVNTAYLTLKQMFDISANLVAEQEGISNLETIGWEKHSWKYLSLIGDERIIHLQRAKVYVFSDSVLCLGRIHHNPGANEAWKKRIEWITTSQSYRDFDGISGGPTEFEWNIFTGFDTLHLCNKVKDLLSSLRKNTRNFHRKNSIWVDVQRHFLWNERQWKRMCGKCESRIFIRKEVWYRTVVIHWSRFRTEVVFYGREQSTRNLGPYRGKDVGGIRWKMSNFPCNDSIVQRST